MKTIKEESEFIRNLSLSLLGVSKNIDYVTCADREKYAFLKGVEFAQQWIPVKEELPSEENELINVPVICITGFGNYRISKYNGNEWDSDEIVTFWRPVERQ